jgi:hypothetical protein
MCLSQRNISCASRAKGRNLSATSQQQCGVYKGAFPIKSQIFIINAEFYIISSPPINMSVHCVCQRVWWIVNVFFLNGNVKIWRRSKVSMYVKWTNQNYTTRWFSVNHNFCVVFLIISLGGGGGGITWYFLLWFKRRSISFYLKAPASLSSAYTQLPQITGMLWDKYVSVRSMEIIVYISCQVNISSKGKGNVHPITGHKGPEVE